MKTRQERAQEFRNKGATPRDALLLAVNALCTEKLDVSDPGVKTTIYNNILQQHGMEDAIDYVARKLTEESAGLDE